ncbi:MAG: hypothetical protein D6828_01565 [Nitrospirae bacterium]|nr:MAG: hypothetical protein D6828_01565 [Nitrospirota bacterium]
MKNEGGDTVIMTAQPLQKPKGFIDTISEIQQVASMEGRGAVLPENFFTIKNRLDFFTVGLKGAFISGLITAMMTPFAIGVIEKKIPVFGTYTPNTFDKVFVFILALSYAIGYGIFIGSAGRYSNGVISRAMIRNFLGGVISGATFKMIIAFVFFHFVYFFVITDSVLGKIFGFLYKTGLNRQHLNSFWNWIFTFKPVFLTSAWFVVITTLVFLAVPVFFFVKSLLRREKTLFTEMRGG